MVDCAKYLAATQGGSNQQASSLVSVLTASHIHSQDISLRVKQAIVAQEHDGGYKVGILLQLTLITYMVICSHQTDFP